jgi:hypothetical protein
VGVFIITVWAGADVGRHILPERGIGSEELRIGILEGLVSFLLAVSRPIRENRALLTVDHEDIRLVESLTSDGSHSIGNGVPGEGVGVIN